MTSQVDISKLIKFTNTYNLLYVEDNKEARDSMLGLLSNFFTRITVANDGIDGLQKFNIDKFNLILTDIHMPNMNGSEMITKIREINKDIYIVVLSAYNYSDNNLNFNTNIVDDFLVKPIDMNHLINALMKIYKKEILNV